MQNRTINQGVTNTLKGKVPAFSPKAQNKHFVVGPTLDNGIRECNWSAAQTSHLEDANKNPSDIVAVVVAADVTAATDDMTLVVEWQVGLYASVMALFLLMRSMSEVERWTCLLEPRAWGDIPRKGTSPSARRSESRG